MTKYSVLFLLCSLSACHLPGAQEVPESKVFPRDLQVQLADQNMGSEQISDFLIQSIERKQGKKLSNKAKKTAREIWKTQRNDRANSQRTPELRIDDVILSETNQSIMEASAPASIAPDFTGKEIRLTINGEFKDRKKDLQQSSFLFTLDPELLAQSFLWTSDRQPRSRVLLDQSRLLETESVSGNQIQVKFNTERDETFLLKGLHHLSVEHGNYYTDTLIQIGDPVPLQASLAPQIDEVQVLTNQQGKPSHVWVKGQHLMLVTRMNYALIDQDFGFTYQTEILADGGSEMTIHIPDPKTFDITAQHSLTLAPPFGTAFAQFGGQQ